MTDFDQVPEGTETDERPANIMGRLLYLTVLLRVTDARLRHGHGRGRRSGVLEGQGRVLRLLDLHSPITQKELAYLLGIRSQSLGELLAKLEEDEYIKRAPNPEDKRTMIVEITEQGRGAVGAQPELLDEDATFGLEPDELEQLSGLLDKVIANIEESLPDGVDRRLGRMRAMWSGEEPDGADRGWQGRPGGPDGPEFGRGPRGGRGGGRRGGHGGGRGGGRREQDWR